MKIGGETGTLEKKGISQHNDFTIKAGSAAFKILSSSLYSDKVLAVLRELSCNAKDAHDMRDKFLDKTAKDLKDKYGIEKKFLAPKDTTWDLIFPTKYSQELIIRDYGIGMSHDNVMELYTSYFSSTKSDSNDLIGGFGLGSKSPFAYTEAFTLESRWNGKVRKYLCIIGDDHTPEINYVGEKDTTDYNGLSVKMAVNPNDINSFVDKASKLFSHFKVLPNIKGRELDIQKYEYSYETEDVGIINTSKVRGYRSYTNEFKAVMGEVAYKISLNALNNVSQDDLKMLKSLENSYCHLFFDIGELELAPSREALSYTKETIESLIKKGWKITKELQQTVDNDFKDTKTLWEKVKKREEYRSNNPLVEHLLSSKVIKVKYKFRGKYTADVSDRISPYETTEHSSNTYGADSFLDNKTGKYVYLKRKTFPNQMWTTSIDNHFVNSQRITPNWRDENHVWPKHLEYIFFVDVLRGGMKRVQYYFQQMRDNDKDKWEKVHHKGILLIKGNYSRDFIKLLGNPPSDIVKKASDIEIPKDINPVIAKKPAKVWRFNQTSKYWKEDEVQLDTISGWYVPFSYGVMEQSSLEEIIKYLDFTNETVWGIPKSRLNEIKDNTKLTLLDHSSVKKKSQTLMDSYLNDAVTFYAADKIMEEVDKGEKRIFNTLSKTSRYNKDTSFFDFFNETKSLHNTKLHETLKWCGEICNIYEDSSSFVKWCRLYKFIEGKDTQQTLEFLGKKLDKKLWKEWENHLTNWKKCAILNRIDFSRYNKVHKELEAMVLLINSQL